MENMVNELVKIDRNEEYGLVVSSRVIADRMGKRHDHVVRDLEKILENPNVGSLIIPTSYAVEGQKRKYKEYLLTKDGFTLYMFNVQGYNDIKIAYINRFNEMEQSLLQQQRFGGFYIPPDYAGALQLAADFAKENEEQKKTIKEQKAQLVIQAPKVEFANQVESAENSISIGAFAKALQKNGVRIGRNRMMLWFRKNGYLGSQGKEKNKPKQFSINNGYMESELYTVTSKKTGKVNVYDAPRITGKGIVYFTKKYLDSVKSV